MNTIRLLVLLIAYISLTAPASAQWFSADVEVSDKVRIGNVSQFNPISLAFDDGIQVYSVGDSPAWQSVGAYLFETGLADRTTTAEITTESGSVKSINVAVVGDGATKAAVNFRAKVIALEGKSLGSNSMLFSAGVKMSQSSIDPLFSNGAQCLLLTGRSYEFSAFYFSRQRFSPFKDLNAFEAHRKNDLKQKIISIERDTWGAYDWIKIRASGYRDRPYHTAAVVYQGRVYLASFFDKGHAEESLPTCIAYNNIAISDLTSFFKN